MVEPLAHPGTVVDGGRSAVGVPVNVVHVADRGVAVRDPAHLVSGPDEPAEGPVERATSAVQVGQLARRGVDEQAPHPRLRPVDLGRSRAEQVRDPRDDRAGQRGRDRAVSVQPRRPVRVRVDTRGLARGSGGRLLAEDVRRGHDQLHLHRDTYRGRLPGGALDEQVGHDLAQGPPGGVTCGDDGLGVAAQGGVGGDALRGRVQRVRDRAGRVRRTPGRRGRQHRDQLSVGPAPLRPAQVGGFPVHRMGDLDADHPATGQVGRARQVISQRPRQTQVTRSLRRRLLPGQRELIRDTPPDPGPAHPQAALLRPLRGLELHRQPGDRGLRRIRQRLQPFDLREDVEIRWCRTQPDDLLDHPREASGLGNGLRFFHDHSQAPTTDKPSSPRSDKTHRTSRSSARGGVSR